MAAFNFRSVQGATTTYLPLNGWQYEYAPWMAGLKLLVQSTVADSTMQITSGTETIQENSPIMLNAAALSDINVPQVRWRAAAGDRLKILITVVTAATITGQLTIARIG